MRNVSLLNTNDSLQEDSPITIGLNFPSTSDADSALSPSDAHGAVGLDHIVEINNGRYRVYGKDTGDLIEDFILNQFWREAGVDIELGVFAFDPRILYDPFSERWFAAGAYKLGDPDSTFLVAVSNESDPTQGWTGFELDPLGLQVDVDYPTIGLNSEGVFVVSGNEPGSLPVGGAMYVLPKDDLINGSIANATLLEISSTNSLGDTIQPVVNLDNTGQPHLLYRVLNLDLDLTSAFDRDIISGSIDEPVLEEDGEGDLISVAPFLDVIELGGAKQPATDRTLDTIESRLKTSLVLQNGTVWGVQDVANEGRAAVRWFQIDADTNQLLQEGLIADPDFDFFYGSIAVNDYDDVAIAFNGSSETQFASTFAVVGDTFGGETTFSEPILLEQGIASYTDGSEGFAGSNSLRWADYSATVVDPEDPFTFWTFQTLPTGADDWTTQITEFSIPEINVGLIIPSGVFPDTTRGNDNLSVQNDPGTGLRIGVDVLRGAIVDFLKGDDTFEGTAESTDNNAYGIRNQGNVSGNRGLDTIIGNSKASLLGYGIYNLNGGNISGAQGNDTMTGYSSESDLGGYGIYNSIGSNINGNRGHDTITGTATKNEAHSVGIQNQDTSNISGDRGNDSMIGTASESYAGYGIYNLNGSNISGDQGHDTITGTATDNSFNIGIWNEASNISSDQGNDSITGDATRGDLGHGIYNFKGSNLSGDRGNDIITGTATENSFSVGIWNEASNMSGDQGDDTMKGYSSESSLGGYGIHNLNGGNISGDQGNDSMMGDSTGGVLGYGIYNLNGGNISGDRGHDSIIGTASDNGESVGIQNEASNISGDQGNDSMMGTATESALGYGIYNLNRGNISGDQGHDSITGTASDNEEQSVGIQNEASNISGDQGNDSMTGDASGSVLGYGIYNLNGGNISGDEGNDSMIGTATESDLGYGIYNAPESEIDMGEGTDEITGLGSSVGIYNEGNILLGNGNDMISATGSTSFTDYDGGGTIFLEDGNDMISGFGNQTVNGGNGNRDTANFNFGMDDITVSGVTDNSLTLNNNDIAMTFIDLEIFEFTDGTKSFTDLAGMT